MVQHAIEQKRKPTYRSIGRKFLNLMDKLFPNNNKVNKIFNANNVKVSYMTNTKTAINGHNMPYPKQR